MRRIRERIHRALRWSEKYIKTDMVFLVSRSSFSLVTQAITSLAILAFAVVVGHVLSKEAYGEYKYALSIISLLSLFSLNNIGGAVFQSTAAGYGGALYKGFWANIRWSFAVFLGALALAAYYFIMHNPQLAAEILIGGCLSPFVASANLYSPYLAGKKAFIRQMFYSIVDNLLTIGIMIATVLLTGNPVILVAVYFVSNLLAALFFYRRTEQLYLARQSAHDEGMLTYSKHLSVMGILGSIADNLDQVLVFHFAGAAQVAIFNFATAIPDQLKTPIKTLDTMLQAKFIGRTTREIQSGIHNKFLWYFIFSVVAIIAYFFAAPFIFAFLFPNYTGSVFYSQLYILSLLAITFDPAGSYLSARKKVREGYISGAVVITFHLASMLVGIIWWGILGLVLAKVATRFLSGLVSYALYRRASKYDLLHTT